MKSQTGFSYLVLFIAAVFTAALAAYAVVQATTTAQSNAAVASTQAVQRSSTSLQIEKVLGLVNTTSSEIYELSIYTELAPGSQPISLSQTPLLIYTSEYPAQQFEFGGANTTLPTAYNGKYIVYLNDSQNTDGMLTKGYIGPGDVADLVIYLNESQYLKTNEYVTITLLPNNGQPAEVSFETPSALIYPSVQLF